MATTGGDHPPAIGQGPSQAAEHGGALEHGRGMDGHQAGLLAEVVAAGIDQAERIDLKIGAQPGHAAHIEGAGGFHQHDDPLGPWGRCSSLNHLRPGC